ncbi:MAG: hypothetical protein IJW45_02095 [Oscillospiraceae bacterium]|nr:hypothetical protein [Oscillospiraceae bacterium]
MKRWRLLLAIILAVCMTGCASGVSDQPTEGGTTEPSTQADPNSGMPVLEMSELLPVGTFREGKLLAQRRSDGAIVCIDKKGHILFQLPDGYGPCHVGDGGFYNGLALVSRSADGQMHLCTEDGKIVTPASLGADRFLLCQSILESQQERFFADGYIMAEKDGQLGLLDSSLQWVVPLSESYWQSIDGFVQRNTDADWGAEFYYDSGRFLSPLGMIDIVTGLEEGIPLDRSDLAYPSSFWEEWRDASSIMFQDGLSRDGTMALKLEGWLAHGVRVPTFSYVDGYAGVITIAGEASAFTVIDEQGERCFDPVAIYGSGYDLDPVTGLYCIDGADQSGDLLIQIFDRKGLRYEYRYRIPEAAEHCSATVQDGVIMVCVRYDVDSDDSISWELFDLSFRPLYT